MEQDLLFVCGCPRSGTTELTKILNSHDRIVLGVERYTLYIARHRRLSADLFSPDRFFDVQEGDTHYGSFDALKDTRIDIDLTKAKFRNARYVGDKIPKLYNFYGDVFSAFPKAKCVFIVRNIFDVAASFKRRAINRQEWDDSRGVAAAIDDWNASLKSTLTFLDTGRLRVIQFEDFILSGSGYQELLTFLNIDLQVLTPGRTPRKTGNDPKREDILTADEKRLIAVHADFESYRSLIDTTATAPKQSSAPRHFLSTIFKYKETDRQILDYDYTAIPGCSFGVRKTANPGAAGGRIACLGSAATFGRFVGKPFATLLADTLGAEVKNFGFGGGRFETFLNEPALLEQCARCDIVVVEFMSARNYGSDLFEPRNHLGGFGRLGDRYAERVRADDPDSPLLKPPVFIERLYDWAEANLDWDELLQLRRQILSAYVADGIRLIREIGVPVVLLWFSQRPIDVDPKPGSFSSWTGGFPHFVDRSAVDAIRAHGRAMVEVVSSAGMPSRLVSASTGKEVSIYAHQKKAPHLNYYYPSAEMHEVAAERLAPVIRDILDGAG